MSFETSPETPKRFADLLPPRAGKARAARCVVIGEVAQAHDGSLGMAHAFIDVIADAGADAVKFQTHIAAAESTPSEPWRVRFSRQDATRYDYWKRMEFSESAWSGLKAHAQERGLWFLSSPFSRAAVDLLERVGVAAWKIASGETGSGDLVDAVLDTGRPVLLSTGMSDWREIDAAVERVRGRGVELALLQCTSAYPCPPEKVGVNVLDEFRRRYGVPVGLSDHSGKIFPGLAAATLGAEVLEVHVAFSRDMFGPDVPVSLVPAELARLVEGVRFNETMLAHPIDKDASYRETEALRGLFTKSVVAARDLPAGTVLSREVLALKKPGSGIPAAKLSEVVGSRLTRAVHADELLAEADLEPRTAASGSFR
jgi:N-acetylneuraminate synthase